MFKLIHTFGNVIHSGTRQECELILKAFETHGTKTHNLEIVEADKGPTMSDTTREAICEELFNSRMSYMFGDGLEQDYARDGVTIVGLNEMSDTELLEEYEQVAGEDDELLIKAKTEMGIDDIIRN